MPKAIVRARVAKKAAPKKIPTVARGKPAVVERPAMVIQRGGGRAMTVNGKTTKTKVAPKPAVAAVAKAPRKTAGPRVERNKSFVDLDVMSRDAVRQLAALVKREIEGKPLRKRKVYPQRTSKTLRIPIQLVPEVQALVERFRKKNGLPTTPGRAPAKPVGVVDEYGDEDWRKE